MKPVSGYRCWRASWWVSLLLDGAETPADAARRKEEPVHEYPLAIVVRIVRQQPVPFVLLLAVALAIALLCLDGPAERRRTQRLEKCWLLLIPPPFHQV